MGAHLALLLLRREEGLLAPAERPPHILELRAKPPAASSLDDCLAVGAVNVRPAARALLERGSARLAPNAECTHHLGNEREALQLALVARLAAVFKGNVSRADLTVLTTVMDFGVKRRIALDIIAIGGLAAAAQRDHHTRERAGHTMIRTLTRPCGSDYPTAGIFVEGSHLRVVRRASVHNRLLQA